MTTTESTEGPEKDKCSEAPFPKILCFPWMKIPFRVPVPEIYFRQSDMDCAIQSTGFPAAAAIARLESGLVHTVSQPCFAFRSATVAQRNPILIISQSAASFVNTVNLDRRIGFSATEPTPILQKLGPWFFHSLPTFV